MTLPAPRIDAVPHRLSGALEGVAHELAMLQGRMLHMQDVCSAANLGGALDASVVREMQGLDLAAQRLEVLATFVRAVAQILPYDPALDLNGSLDAMTLSDVAGRLGARAAGLDMNPFDAADPGDFDLF